MSDHQGWQSGSVITGTVSITNDSGVAWTTVVVLVVGGSPGFVGTGDGVGVAETRVAETGGLVGGGIVQRQLPNSYVTWPCGHVDAIGQARVMRPYSTLMIASTWRDIC